MRALFALTFILISYSYFAQDTISYIVNDKEYKIFEGMDGEDKSEFLEEIDAVELETAPFTDVSFPVRITREDGSQNLMRYGEVEFIHKKDLESIDFFTYTLREIGITFGKYKEQRKIIFRGYNNHKSNKKKDSWDEIIWRNEKIYEPDLRESQQGQQYTEYSTMPEFYVKKDGLWGVIGIYEGIDIQIIVPAIYKEKESIRLDRWPWNYIPNFDKIRKKFKADLIEPLEEMDEFYKVRNKKNKKWGVYQDFGGYELTLDTEYDSIIGIENDNQRIVILWKDNHVGLSDDEGHILYSTSYDNYELINLDYMYGIALKINDQWTLHSLDEPKKLIEQTADSPEQLLEYWLNR